MNVGLAHLRVATRSHGSELVAFSDRIPARGLDRTQVNESHRIAVGALDRHGLAAARHRPGEADRSTRGRDNSRAGGAPYVDTPVLSGGVRVVVREREGLQHRPVDRPGPRERSRRQAEHKRCERDDG
jgi:hypothetical protein